MLFHNMTYEKYKHVTKYRFTLFLSIVILDVVISVFFHKSCLYGTDV